MLLDVEKHEVETTLATWIHFSNVLVPIWKEESTLPVWKEESMNPQTIVKTLPQFNTLQFGKDTSCGILSYLFIFLSCFSDLRVQLVYLSSNFCFKHRFQINVYMIRHVWQIKTLFGSQWAEDARKLFIAENMIDLIMESLHFYAKTQLG